MKTETPPPEQHPPNYDQLHEKACIDCGSKKGPFVAAGHVYTRNCGGGRLSWAVVACVQCPGGSQ